jgi:hypothetical protein
MVDPAEGIRMIRQRKVGLVAVSVAALVAAIGVRSATARITIRPHAPTDTFFFHAHYSGPFDPSTDFTIEIWNCASGVPPSFLSGVTPPVVCRDGTPTGFTVATMAYAVHIPGGSCVDHGRSCYYRNRAFDRREGGTRYFRVEYPRRNRGNRVWLESSGDLSAADQANMLLLIRIDGNPRAVLEETFDPLPGGGWFSEF